jgi:hypothetical protein
MIIVLKGKILDKYRGDSNLFSVKWIQNYPDC